MNPVLQFKKFLIFCFGQSHYIALRQHFKKCVGPISGFLTRRIRIQPPQEKPVPSPFGFPVSPQNALEEIGQHLKPTKRLHNCLPFYWMHFRDIRDKVQSVLEIGIQTDRSLKMWEQFFPNAVIYGLDIDPACEKFQGGRRKVIIGDQSDAACLEYTLGLAGGSFDIVIDDGSHAIDHQIKTFNYLFPRLTRHGIYVVEDTGGVVDDVNLRTVNALKKLIDHIMYWPLGRNPSDWVSLKQLPETAPWEARNTIGISFYRWIVFIQRGRNPEDNPFLNNAATKEPGVLPNTQKPNT